MKARVKGLVGANTANKTSNDEILLEFFIALAMLLNNVLTVFHVLPLAMTAYCSMQQTYVSDLIKITKLSRNTVLLTIQYRIQYIYVSVLNCNGFLTNRKKRRERKKIEVYIGEKKVL